MQTIAQSVEPCSMRFVTRPIRGSFPSAGRHGRVCAIAAFNGSPQATHAVDVTGYLDRGIESLLCHELYLANLGDGSGDPGAFLRSSAEGAGASLGVRHAVHFELVDLLTCRPITPPTR